ncbi:MAG: class I SAM-dependent methyltransferase, partial [Candidatus Caenarcaniphilales bacterium]|nr:class I SAM-dependent methyltransferase [Candidatus Caenarcaniphilales bacterium]
LACGTGRMSLMLLEQNWFAKNLNSSIEAVDFSEGMLKKFEVSLHKLDEELRNKVIIQRMDLSDMNNWSAKADSSYDFVSLMEVGEFLPGFAAIVQQVSRVLRPGSLFLLSKPPEWMGALYPGRHQTAKDLKALLLKNGFESVEIKPWTERYEIVYAIKGNT